MFDSMENNVNFIENDSIQKKLLTLDPIANFIVFSFVCFINMKTSEKGKQKFERTAQ